MLLEVRSREVNGEAIRTRGGAITNTVPACGTAPVGLTGMVKESIEEEALQDIGRLGSGNSSRHEGTGCATKAPTDDISLRSCGYINVDRCQ